MKKEFKVGDLCQLRVAPQGYKYGELVLVLEVENPRYCKYPIYAMHQRTGKKASWSKKALEKINASI